MPMFLRARPRIPTAIAPRIALRAAACAAAFAVAAFASGAAFAQDALVIAPEELQGALASSGWQSHRASRGTSVVVQTPGAGEAEIAAAVKKVHQASGGKLRFVLLLGDVDKVPCARRPVIATKRWERALDIATDAPFADLDGDGVPDLAIGRYPATDAADAKAYLARVVAYETNRDFGEWRRRATVVAGTGGFGPAQDLALEQITKKYLVNNIPASMLVSATYGNPLSAWCPPPAEFQDTALERINEGSLIFTYIGHGSPRELDKVKVGREKYPIFTAEDPARVEVRHGAPLAAFIACSTGRFDGPDDCLAEMLARRPAGPVAVIASSRVSSPYSNAILAKELLDSVWRENAATAGEILLSMKRRLASAAADDPQRVEMEKLAALFYDPSDEVRAADRAEHQFLYNLVGDPMTRLQRTDALAFDVPAGAEPGATLTVSGTAPYAGKLVAEIARRRDAVVRIGARAKPEEWRKTYATANDTRVATVTASVAKGAFSIDVALPADLPPASYDVRLFLEATDGAAAGGRVIEVRAK